MSQALQFSAVDYLMKPVDEDRLVEAVDRVCKNCGRKEHERPKAYNNINKANKPMRCDYAAYTARIHHRQARRGEYCEAKRSYTVFHFRIISRCLYPSLCSIMKTVEQYFPAVHKSFHQPVHVKEYVRGEGGVIVMSNGAE